MSTRDNDRRTWNLIREQVASMQEGGGLLGYSYARGSIPHPREAGARSTTTWPVGQIADYVIEGNPGQTPLAVREFADRWEVFLDTARLTAHVLNAVESDPSKAMYVGAAMLGGAIGSSMSNKREGMLVGAGLGLLFAAVLGASIDAPTPVRRPKSVRRRQR